MSDALDGFEVVEEVHGWRVGSTLGYPDIVVIECTCGHLSTHDRDAVANHVCHACGRGAQPVTAEDLALLDTQRKFWVLLPQKPECWVACMWLPSTQWFTAPACVIRAVTLADVLSLTAAWFREHP